MTPQTLTPGGFFPTEPASVMAAELDNVASLGHDLIACDAGAVAQPDSAARGQPLIAGGRVEGEVIPFDQDLSLEGDGALRQACRRRAGSTGRSSARRCLPATM